MCVVAENGLFLAAAIAVFLLLLFFFFSFFFGLAAKEEREKLGEVRMKRECVLPNEVILFIPPIYTPISSIIS